MMWFWLFLLVVLSIADVVWAAFALFGMGMSSRPLNRNDWFWYWLLVGTPSAILIVGWLAWFFA